MSTEKDRAETLKFMAEAEAAQKLAEFHEANARKTEAEQVKTEAEAKKLSLEAEHMKQQNVMVKIAADQTKRAEGDELALDRHHHIYHFSRDISAASVKECIDQLTNWHRKNPSCEVEIVFNSPGGSVVDGFALFDYLRWMSSQGHKVTTSALGMAASMAAILLQAGDHRVIAREAWMMIHEAAFMAVGKYGEVEDRVKWVERIQGRILDIFAERSTLKRSDIKRKWTRTDWWISSDDALEYGFVDEVR